MMRKKRGYKRETPTTLYRDYKLFAIATEGYKTEPNYFKLFGYMSSKIKVDLIEEIVDDQEVLGLNPNKSSPKWVLDRAVRYIEKEGLSDEDDLWFVMDVDRWSRKQLQEIADYCKKYPNWHIVLSNPCFEVWLYFHKKKDFVNSTANNCQQLKYEISTFDKGGYHPTDYISLLFDAIANAKAADSDPKHYLPKPKETKVYQLGEALLKFISKNDFQKFIETKHSKLY
jgi:hypothetical protein